VAPGALRVSCPCPPASAGAPLQSYLHTFAYGNTVYTDLWFHLQEVGGGWLLPPRRSPFPGRPRARPHAWHR